MRGIVGLASCAVAVLLAARWEKPILLALVRLAQDSVVRAVLVLLGCFAAWTALAAALAGIAVAVSSRPHGDVGVLLLSALGVVALGPFAVPLLPRESLGGAVAATSSGDLRRAGSSRRVARVLGWGGALLSLVTTLPMITAAVLLGLAGLG